MLLCVLLAGCSGGDGLRKPGTEVARDEAPAGLAAKPQRVAGERGLAGPSSLANAPPSSAGLDAALATQAAQAGESGTDGSPSSLSPAFAGMLAPSAPPGPANELMIGFEDSQAASLSQDIIGTSVMDEAALPGRVPSMAPAAPAAPAGMFE